MRERSPDSDWMLVFGCWCVASASTLGALFFSEIMQLPPCVLCGYQRIFMLPLVLLLPVGLFPFDSCVVRYALPLAVAGRLVSAFHLLLVAGVIPEAIRPCTQGVPCSEVRIQWRVGRALERQGLLVRDLEDSFLTLDPPDGVGFDDLLGYSIPTALRSVRSRAAKRLPCSRCRRSPQ